MKKNTKLINILSFLFIIFSSQLGLYLFGKGSGTYSTDLIVPSLIGTIIGCGAVFAHSIYKKRKNGNIPEFDERNIHIIKNIFYNTLLIALSIGSILIVILYSMGVHEISTIAIVSYLALTYMIMGRGALIAKHRF